MTTFYEMLGVPKNASQDEIRHASLAKAERLSPDRYDGAPPDVVRAVTESLALIEQAGRVLGDPAARADYDSELEHGEAEAHEPGAIDGGLTGDPSSPSEENFAGPIADPLAKLEMLAGWIGREHPSSHVTVPDVCGMHASDAFYAVARADLHINMVRLTANPAPVDGTVVDQDPQAGASVRRHSTLTVEVWHPEAADDSEIVA